MKGKPVCIVVTDQDRLNIRTAAATQDVDSSTLIRGIIKDKLTELSIPIPEDFDK